LGHSDFPGGSRQSNIFGAASRAESRQPWECMELSRPPARPRLYQGQVKKKSRGLILGAPCPRVTSSVSCLVNKQLRRGELTPPDAGLRAPRQK
jgi:hypothetical protein